MSERVDLEELAPRVDEARQLLAIGAHSGPVRAEHILKTDLPALITELEQTRKALDVWKAVNASSLAEELEKTQTELQQARVQLAAAQEIIKGDAVKVLLGRDMAIALLKRQRDALKAAVMKVHEDGTRQIEAATEILAEAMNEENVKAQQQWDADKQELERLRGQVAAKDEALKGLRGLITVDPITGQAYAFGFLLKSTDPHGVCVRVKDPMIGPTVMERVNAADAALSPTTAAGEVLRTAVAFIKAMEDAGWHLANAEYTEYVTANEQIKASGMQLVAAVADYRKEQPSV